MSILSFKDITDLGWDLSNHSDEETTYSLKTDSSYYQLILYNNRETFSINGVLNNEKIDDIMVIDLSRMETLFYGNQKDKKKLQRVMWKLNIY